jgi:hypothetical protein
LARVVAARLPRSTREAEDLDGHLAPVIRG